MTYTRPPFDQADATWEGATAYVRLPHDAADAKQRRIQNFKGRISTTPPVHIAHVQGSFEYVQIYSGTGIVHTEPPVTETSVSGSAHQTTYTLPPLEVTVILESGGTDFPEEVILEKGDPSYFPLISTQGYRPGLHLLLWQLLDVDVYISAQTPRPVLSVDVFNNASNQTFITISGFRPSIQSYVEQDRRYSVRKRDIVFQNLPGKSHHRVRVTLTNPEAETVCETFVIGRSREFGIVRPGVRLGIWDNSRKHPDTFGIVNLKKQSYSRRTNTEIELTREEIDPVFNLLSRLRSNPTTWITWDEVNPSIVYGLYKDFTIDHSDYDHTLCRLELESLAYDLLPPRKRPFLPPVYWTSKPYASVIIDEFSIKSPGYVDSDVFRMNEEEEIRTRPDFVGITRETTLVINYAAMQTEEFHQGPPDFVGITRETIFFISYTTLQTEEFHQGPPDFVGITRETTLVINYSTMQTEEFHQGPPSFVEIEKTTE